MVRKIAVIGCASFLGRAICQRAARQQWAVRGIGSRAALNAIAASNPTLDQFYSDEWLKDVQWKTVNVHKNLSGVEEHIQGCDAVIHTFDDDFSQPSKSIWENIRANFRYGHNNSLNNWLFLQTSQRLAEMCARADVPHFLMVEDGSRSSFYKDAAAGDKHDSPLSVTHDSIVQMSNQMTVSILRPGYMCGPDRYLSIPISFWNLQVQTQRERAAKLSALDDDASGEQYSHLESSDLGKMPIHVDSVARCVMSMIDSTNLDSSTFRFLTPSGVHELVLSLPPSS